ncbi:MAG: conjugative transposon protein TraM [Reichenbachiella sp.]|uniref:conjugative transposon protein TraM n=1 Tax=Reichenbachiella sp. TaxID=2184521 RepID=UPI003266BC80
MNFWRKLDTVQKLMVVVGLIGTLGLVGFVVVDNLGLNSKKVEDVREPQNTVEVKSAEISYEEKTDEKSLLDKIRGRRDYLKDTLDKSKKYGIGFDDFGLEEGEGSEESDGEEIVDNNVEVTKVKSTKVLSKRSVAVVQPPVEKKESRSGSGRKRRSRVREDKNSEDRGNGESTGMVDMKKYVNAVVHGDHKVVTGSNVLLRTKEDFTTNEGVEIPRNSYITVECKIQKNRLFLTTSSIKLASNKRAIVKVRAFDANDTREGMDVSGSVKQEIKNDVVGDVVKEGSGLIKIPFSGTIGSGAKKSTTDPVAVLSNKDEVLLEIL